MSTASTVARATTIAVFLGENPRIVTRPSCQCQTRHARKRPDLPAEPRIPSRLRRVLTRREIAGRLGVSRLRVGRAAGRGRAAWRRVLEFFTYAELDDRDVSEPAAGAGLSNRDQLSGIRSEEHTSELQSHSDLVCRLLLEK